MSQNNGNTRRGFTPGGCYVVTCIALVAAVISLVISIMTNVDVMSSVILFVAVLIINFITFVLWRKDRRNRLG